MKYLLNWNDEYLDMRIICGPLADDAAAQQAIKETVIERLIQLDMADNSEDAEEMYLTAEKEDMEELHVNLCGASIIYGSGYEDRYQIVEYGQDAGKTPARGKSKHYKDVKNGRGTNLTIGPESYISIGPGGADIMARGNGKVVAFNRWEDLMDAIDPEKAAYYEATARR